MKVEVANLGSPSPISLMVSVGVKQHERRKTCDLVLTDRMQNMGYGSVSLHTTVVNLFVPLFKKNEKMEIKK